MANTVTYTTLLDSPNITIIHAYLASDGAAGELSDSLVIDASTLTGATYVRQILSIQGCLRGFQARLEFEATADSPAIVLPPDMPFYFDFHDCPIKNFAGAGINGDVSLTTTGFTASGDEGFFILKVRKD